MQRIKQYIATTIAALVLGFGLAPALSAVTYAADPKSEVCTAINGNAGCATTTGPELDGVIKSVVTILSTLVGILAVIFIIVGGLKYVTSGGDASKTASAKNTIIYALVGLVIAALAFTIAKFVLSQV